MPESSDVQEFPELNSKLAAPTKKSLFERQRAEAEAKRQRQDAETAAVLDDFVKSFEGDDQPSSSSQVPGGRLQGPRFGGGESGHSGPPKRHYSSLGSGAGRGSPASNNGPRSFPISGPGSLGPLPSSFTKKRTYDGKPLPRGESDYGRLTFDNSAPKQDTNTVFQTSEDEDDANQTEAAAEKAVPKPTLHLSSLPPTISVSMIKALFPPNLGVEGVKLSTPTGSSSSTTERKTVSAIVTLGKDTAGSDIDNAVNSLQGAYLGWGFYLSLSRHLSSASLYAAANLLAGPSLNTSTLPFGARPRLSAQSGAGGSMSRAPPPREFHRGGIAPPSSYSQGIGGNSDLIEVVVTPPSDLRQLKLIHKTLESLLKHGPEFEALLMSRSEVQQDEQWAWIWNARSQGGVYYRWRLWEILTGSEKKPRRGERATRRSHLVFDTGSPWTQPEKPLRFQYTTKIDEFVSDEEYDTSEDENSEDDEQNRPLPDGLNASRTNSLGAATNANRAYLNPLKKSKLTYLLARLPTSIGRLRKGDVARVTTFAIDHAGSGADEVVDMVVSNIETPFSLTSANLDKDDDSEASQNSEGEAKASKEADDRSTAQLVALYVVSDILSSSSTSGVRHAWKYRQMFEGTLRARNVFATLGRLDKTLKWGRLRAEKWRRSVGSVLSLWEGWCVFPQSAQEEFVEHFTNPPLTTSELEAAAKADEAAAERRGKNKWKAVDAEAGTAAISETVDNAASTMDIEEDDGDLDGEPMDEDEYDDGNLDGEPMEDIDGELMEEAQDGTDDVKAASANEKSGDPARSETSLHDMQAAEESRQGEADPNRLKNATQYYQPKRPRPSAVDMFADSDEE